MIARLGSKRRAKRNEKIAEMYRRGLPARVMAEQFGLSTQYVFALLRKMGVEPRPRTFAHLVATAKAQEKSERNAAIQGAYRDGVSCRKLAAEHGLSRQRVLQIIRAGIAREGKR